jgi:hypothetical protein
MPNCALFILNKPYVGLVVKKTVPDIFKMSSDLADTRQKVGDVKYADQDGIYSVMTAQLFFERRALFFNFNFVLPCILITLLVVAGFALPCESGEKIGLRNQIKSNRISHFFLGSAF